MIFRKLPDLAYLQECFICNPSEGTLEWRERPRHHFANHTIAKSMNTTYAGTQAGFPGRMGYTLVGIKRKTYLRSRIIWMMAFAKQPESEIDHINGIKSDDRIVNLRPATHQQNMHNYKPRIDRGLPKGVILLKSRSNYRAQIKLNGKNYCLGHFKTPEEAHEAYCEGARRLHGEYWNPG